MVTEEQSPWAGDGPDATFRAELKAGKFVLQQCTQCSRHIYHPRAICPFCGSAKLRTTEASGKGTVYSTSIVRQRAEAGGDYNVSLIDLAEGPRMMSWVVGLPHSEVRIGMAVRAKIADIDGTPALVFEKD